MDIEKVYSMLTDILPNSKVLKNEPMSKHTSFKIGGNADILIKIEDVEDIKCVLEFSSKRNIPLYIIGNGSNLLVKDNGIRGIVLMMCTDAYKIDKQENRAIVTAEAGVKLASLAQALLKEEITGFEFASRDTRNIGWSNKNECWCTWKRNERYCCYNNIYRRTRKHKYNFK